MAQSNPNAPPGSPRLYQWSSRLSSPPPSRPTSPIPGSYASMQNPIYLGSYSLPPPPGIARRSRSPSNSGRAGRGSPVPLPQDPMEARNMIFGYPNTKANVAPPVTSNAQANADGPWAWQFAQQQGGTVPTVPMHSNIPSAPGTSVQGQTTMEAPILKLLPPTPTPTAVTTFSGAQMESAMAVPLEPPAGHPEPTANMEAPAPEYDASQLSIYYQGRT
ncbi:hypothetical protein NMY22_g12320 [Coprinellus aureogranulatus]|nr:hypothetical protein NMY22_g12320 [Coprinellus aureogranulatus]